MHSKKLFVLVFALYLILPGVKWGSGYFKLPQLKENRNHLAFPGAHEDAVKNLVMDKQFVNKLMAYFDDNFPFRDLLIMLSNQIKFELFGESKEVIIGRDGWLFDRVTIKNQQSLDNLSESELDRTVERVRNLNKLFKQRGMHLLLVLVPWKNTVIDDVLDGKYRRATPNIYDRFTSKLRQSADVDFIDVRAVLKDSNNSRESYFKTDAHWNYWGASLVAREVINRLGKITMSGTVWQEQIPHASIRPIIGAEAESMGLFHPIKEYYNDIEFPPLGCTKPSAPITEPYGAEYRADGKCAINLIPKTVMVGNSFNMYFERLGIFEYFTHGYRLWDVYFFTKQEDLIPVDAKVVVLQLQEMQLGGQYINDSWWSKFEQEHQAAGNTLNPDQFSKGAGLDGFVAPIKPLN